MEVTTQSECGAITNWRIFRVLNGGQLHMIGHSDNYGFDIITQELSHIHYDHSNKLGSATTRSGIIYELYGSPRLFGPILNPSIQEFTKQHNCEIKYLRMREISRF